MAVHCGKPPLNSLSGPCASSAPKGLPRSSRRSLDRSSLDRGSASCGLASSHSSSSVSGAAGEVVAVGKSVLTRHSSSSSSACSPLVCSASQSGVTAPVQPVHLAQDVQHEGEDLGWRDDFHSHYIVGKAVGSGSFGDVFMGINLHNGKEVAIKSLPKVRGKLTLEKTLEKLAREVDILERLQGYSGVIQLVDCFEDSQSVKIVTELCTGGDLQNFIEQDNYEFNEASLAMVALEVLKVVNHCHEMGLLHGDVKPANFCIKDKANNPLLLAAREGTAVPRPNNWLKAIDFGCSQHLPSLRSLTKRTGTPVYMAPEIFGRRYHAEADMWSLGVMLYQLYAHRFPFWDTMEECKASKLDEVATAVTASEIPYDYGPWFNMSQEGLDFIKGCLTRDPHCRMTMEEALTHPWLCANSTPKLSPAQQARQQQGARSNNIVSKSAPKPSVHAPAAA